MTPEDATAAETARARWQARYEQSLARGQVRDADFTTLSGLEVEPAYGTDDSYWPVVCAFRRGLYRSG